MDDVRLIIIAGSDSLAVTISAIMYYLASNPAIYKKLQSILDSIFPGGDSEYSYTKAASIPYLDAIINEALRLQPPAISSLPRVTPTEVVSVPPYTVNRDPRYWEKPAEFIPERWTDEKPELIKDRCVYTPFTIGIYQCPGKSLAYMEIRMVIVRIALSFKVAFVDDDDSV
ncbi:cytochrome P450 [Wilcoxina mikolae CBS 423.85]|nr:cytochrome P450 [Wilcoxina mikolae CBS 423.85]